MARFQGIIGFAIEVNTSPGIWENKIIEKTYTGNVINRSIKNQSSGNINDDLILVNEISIVYDPFAFENYPFIKYVVFKGVKWKITDINVSRPRINMRLGGVYNG